MGEEHGQCQWYYRFEFFEGIRLYWLFHVGFGEIKFLKWCDVINSNSWFLAILKDFQKVCLYSIQAKGLSTNNFHHALQILSVKHPPPPPPPCS